MSLIVTYASRDDESGIGYYRRLSDDNELSGWRNLADTAGVERSRDALLTRTKDVALNLGLEPAWAESARQKEECCRNWGHLHRKGYDAVCPVCLAESPYLRHPWEHTYVTACPRHLVQLVDQCNACGHFLSPERLNIGFCACGHDLKNLPRLPATQAQHWLSLLISSNGQQQPDSTKPFMNDLDVNVLVKVIRTLCIHIDPNRPKLPRRAAWPKSIAEAVEFLAPLETLFADWPTGFRRHVEQRIVAGRKDARTLNTLLGDWYISLRKLCQSSAFEPLLQVIIDVASEKSDCLLGLDSAKAMAKNTTGYMRAPDAAKAMGISVSRLHESIQLGECEYRTRRTGTRGHVYEIPCAEVERILQRRAAWISDNAACELAGVLPAVLERMKAAGVIRSDVRWREDLMKAGPVERQSIDDLFLRISRQAERTSMTDDTKIAWAHFTSRHMGDKRAIESLMTAIANGEVKAIAHAHILGNLIFRRTDVLEYFGTPLLEAGMSIQQLARTTGWKWESIDHWVNEGLLASETIERRGQSCRVILPHQLIAFRQLFVPLADLAHSMGTKASALSRLLPDIELVGAKRLPDGAMRGGLIRLADLGRLAVIGARAGHDLFVSAA